MAGEEEEVAIEFEVTTGDDGLSFTLNVESSEPISYGEFLAAVKTFLETEEVEPSGQSH